MEGSEHWRVEGAVVRGERTATHATDDQRLLESSSATGWVHTDPWRVLRIQSEFIDGFGTLAELGPAVSVFGSARTPRDHPLYATAERLGAQLVRRHHRRRPRRHGGRQQRCGGGGRSFGGPGH